jgi:amino acid transporter
MPSTANTGTASTSQTLERGQLGLLGVIMPGVAQVAPAFNLFFTTGVMVALAGASAPLIFLISMVGMVATASSLAQFAGVYPSAGSFITYITRAIGTKVAVAIGVITILGYIIASSSGSSSAYGSRSCCTCSRCCCSP